MKLIITIVQDQDVNKLLGVLTENGYSATKLASSGGFLRQGNTTLLIGVDDEKVTELTSLIEDACRSRKQLVSPLASVGRSLNNYMPEPIEVTVGGATIFLMDVQQFIKV